MSLAPLGLVVNSLWALVASLMAVALLAPAEVPYASKEGIYAKDRTATQHTPNYESSFDGPYFSSARGKCSLPAPAPGVPHTSTYSYPLPWPLPPAQPPFPIPHLRPTLLQQGATPDQYSLQQQPARIVPDPCRLHRCGPKWKPLPQRRVPVRSRRIAQRTRSSTMTGRGTRSDIVMCSKCRLETALVSANVNPEPRRRNSAMIPELPSGLPDPLIIGRLRNGRHRQRTTLLHLPYENRYQIFGYLFQRTRIFLTLDPDGVPVARGSLVALTVTKVCTTFRDEVGQMIGVDLAAKHVRFSHWDQSDYDSIPAMLHPSRQQLLTGVLTLTTGRMAVRQRWLVRENLQCFPALQLLEIKFEPEYLPRTWWNIPHDDYSQTQVIVKITGYERSTNSFGRRCAFFSDPTNRIQLDGSIRNSLQVED